MNDDTTKAELKILIEQIKALRPGQTYRLSQLMEDVVEKVALLNHQTWFRLKQTQSQELAYAVACENKSVTKSTPQKELESRRTAFQDVVERILYELHEFS
ncbi:hypothetical protein [Hymenobacter sp. CRA2]|uniref:hypothetical protein n=1 Tax=Hymenobacter sp. CRA2 TaxID=1955620 RepID=UPI00098FE695|nr:hypothetical protein [Hymenobacter sp. CRA2]OON70091.1 hypothetical protein B0919_04940 [Hymenobacter sp. CRA2]